MATTIESPTTAPPEWWERLRDRRAAWWQARPALAARCARLLPIALWVGVLWVAVLLVVLPDVRLSLRAYLGGVWLVVAWFALLRTKTLTWSGTMRFFAACLTWSVLIGVVSTALANAGTLAVSSAGPGIAIAAVTEETFKLLPVALVALLAPRRSARFATVDWALLGVGSGAAFLVVEEMLRRLNWETASGLGLLGKVLANLGPDGLPEGWVRFGLAPWGTSATSDGIATGSHVTLTALVAVCAGLGIAAWRHADRAGAWWRVVAVALPVGALWLAVCDHAMWNTVASWGGATLDGDTPQYLDPTTTTVPWAIRTTWSFTGHGHGRVALLLVAVVAALLVDARRIAARGGAAVVPVTPPGWVTHRTGSSAWSTADATGRAVADAVVGITAAATALAWIVWRDLSQVVVAHARLDGESRRAAMRRGRAFGAAQRQAREDALRDGGGSRTAAAVAVGALLVAGLLVAPALAQQIGALPYDTGSWLAGQLDGLGRWWSDLGPGGQIAVGLGIAALIALSGGSLGLAFGLSGVATYGLSHAHGAATFARDPARATRDYLTTTTPAGAALDLGEFVLTFAPGNFAGAAAGRGVRLVADDFARDPAAALARIRAEAAAHPDAGHIDLSAFFRREPIQLADGTPLHAVDSAADAGMVARYEQYPASRFRAGGAAGAYQHRLYGDAEREILLPDGRTVYPDGMTARYGALADAKYVRADGSSFYLPDSMRGTRMSQLAVAQMDSKLIKLARAADAFGGNAAGGRGVIEIGTNNPVAARVFEARMRALGIRGYVRLEP